MNTYRGPPLPLDRDGKARTVGVEIEFGGLNAKQAAQVVQQVLGGSLVEADPHSFTVSGTSIGDVKVKLDARWVHGFEKPQSFLDSVKRRLAALLGSAMSPVVPSEVITPPIPVDQLKLLEPLIAQLSRAGATGTNDSIANGYGLHLNPEAPSLDAHTVTSILKAFALLSPWLWQTTAPDSTRRMIGFAKPYSDDYVRRLARSDYWPDVQGLIDDYIGANPSRNRDLDMLPLLAYLDEERVRSKLPKEKVNARPAFHYRLPDARIGDPEWSLAKDWNRWVAVEELACDRKLLDAVGAAFQRESGDRNAWADKVSGLAFG